MIKPASTALWTSSAVALTTGSKFCYGYSEHEHWKLPWEPWINGMTHNIVLHAQSPQCSVCLCDERNKVLMGGSRDINWMFFPLHLTWGHNNRAASSDRFNWTGQEYHRFVCWVLWVSQHYQHENPEQTCIETSYSSSLGRKMWYHLKNKNIDLGHANLFDNQSN